MAKQKDWIQGVQKEMEKKGTVGAFTKQAKRAKMSTEEFAKAVLGNPSKYQKKTRERAQFFKNVNPEKFADGGGVGKKTYWVDFYDGEDENGGNKISGSWNVEASDLEEAVEQAEGLFKKDDADGFSTYNNGGHYIQVDTEENGYALYSSDDGWTSDGVNPIDSNEYSKGGSMADGGGVKDVSGNYYSTNDFVSVNKLEKEAEKLFGKDWEAEDDVWQIQQLSDSIGGKYTVDVANDSDEWEEWRYANQGLANDSNDSNYDIFVIPINTYAEGGEIEYEDKVIKELEELGYFEYNAKELYRKHRDTIDLSAKTSPKAMARALANTEGHSYAEGGKLKGKVVDNVRVQKGYSSVRFDDKSRLMNIGGGDGVDVVYYPANMEEEEQYLDEGNHFKKGGSMADGGEVKTQLRKRFEKYSDEDLQSYNGDNEETLKFWNRKDAIDEAVETAMEEYYDEQAYAEGGGIPYSEIPRGTSENEIIWVSGVNKYKWHKLNGAWHPIMSKAQKKEYQESFGYEKGGSISGYFSGDLAFLNW